MKIAVVVAFIVVCLVPLFVISQEKPGHPAEPDNLLGTPTVVPINVNKMFGWYNSNGIQEYNGGGGLTYPKGTALAVYVSGLLWGGKVHDGSITRLNVNGSYYSSGMRPGAMLGLRTNTVQNPADSTVRIYRIRRDFRKTDLHADAADTYRKSPTNVTNADVTKLRAAYASDWAGWPWQLGAPFYDTGFLDASNHLVGANNGVLDWGEDLNHNGYLDPGEDLNRNGVLDGETPGYADADMVLWFVCNDVNGQRIYSSQGVGMEMQGTIWAYNRTDALAHVVYKRLRLIYKGLATTSPSARIDSLYIAQMADPDLGDANDDFAGCDSSLSLGYVYNSVTPDRLFNNYLIPPPAIGFDLMQGPLVRGIAGQDLNHNGVDDAADYAIVDLKTTGPGYINLPMTSFVYFDRATRYGSRYSDPFSSTGWYQTLRGYPPSPAGPTDPPLLINPTTLSPSKFWVSGDPVLHSGWLDGNPIFPGDREIQVASGPFSMAIGDTQEIVMGVVAGLGTDNLSSIKVMKYNDKVAQAAYNNGFKQPKGPAQPNVKVFSLDGKILLEWGLDSLSVAQSENPILFGNYKFEGYNVYQVPDGATDLSTAKRIATFDLIDGIRTISQEEYDPVAGETYLRPVEYGTESGIQRSLLVSRDSIWSSPLVNGQAYYYAVTAYNYTPDINTVVRSVESTPLIIQAIPESSRPGTKYSYAIGDTIPVHSFAGSSDAVVVPVVYNPHGQSGAAYHVMFDTTTSSRTYTWSVVNVVTGKVLYANMTDLSGLHPYRVADGGFDLTVGIPPVGLRQIVDQNGNDEYGPSNPNPVYTVLSQRGTLRSMNGLGTTQRDYEIRFDGRGSYAVRMLILAGQSATVKVPFSVWDIGRGSSDTPVQVIASFRDSGNADIWNVTPHGVSYGDTLFKIFEPIHITNSPYPTSGNDSAGVYAARVDVFRASQSPDEQGNAMWGIQIADKDLNGLPPPTGTVLRFLKFHEIRDGDIKEISPTKPLIDDRKQARADISKINVYPNPYYGQAETPTGLLKHRIMFTHLPGNAKIRLFNLAGSLVRTLVKDDGTGGSQFLEWDLKNEHDLPVASGIYIAFIDMPDIGATKTLKLIIIQGEENTNGF